jgi:hypothetical protein
LTTKAQGSNACGWLRVRLSPFLPRSSLDKIKWEIGMLNIKFIHRECLHSDNMTV